MQRRRFKVTGLHGPSYGNWAAGHSRRATKKYFHKPTATRRQIKARRKLGRR